MAAVKQLFLFAAAVKRLFLFAAAVKRLLLFVAAMKQFMSPPHHPPGAITADRDQRAWIYIWIRLN